ncbi:S8 family serine peptidase, partial [Candidatus Bipolaricaulota bacterium]
MMNRIRLRGRILICLVLWVAMSATPAVVASDMRSRIPQEEAHPRMTTSLQLLAMTAETEPARLETMGSDLGVEVTDGDVVFIVEPMYGRAAYVDDVAIRALGGTVEARSESLLRVRAPADRLLDIADQVSGLALMREPYPRRALAVTSEGVSLTGATDFHSAGYYGQGAKVAIIDLGFIGYQDARDAGELSNVVFTHDYTGDGFETYEDHGVGVAEIVADMAPQAQLYLMMIDDAVDLQNAVNDCIAYGVDVINHSVGWFNSNFYDGTGTIAGIATNARNNGILWVNSAGNSGDDGHWQGAFDDSGDGDGFHEFGLGSDYVDGDGYDEGSRVRVYVPTLPADAENTITVYLTWDDWPLSDQDFDLYLYDSGGAVVASSTRWQTEENPGPPTEALTYTTATDGSNYFEIAIRKYDASTSPEFDMFVFTEAYADPLLEDHEAESSILAPANSTDVLTVGAVCQSQWGTGPQQPFSSQGPSNNMDVKPDIAGPDAVSNWTYGSSGHCDYNGFRGTSASSPHVAGAAALLLSEDPSRTAADLQTKLESDAIDMGAAGKDNVYGSGRMNLEPAPLDPLRGY